MSFAVGRSPACWVRITDRSVSAVHARIDVVAGKMLVCDVGSLGGIVVDGHKVHTAEFVLGREFSVAGWRLGVSLVDAADAPVNEMLEMLDSLRSAGRSCEMLAICRQWIAAAPNLAAAQRAYAQACLDAGQSGPALEAARRAAALKPGDPRSAALEAMALEALGRLGDAKRAWSNATVGGMDRDESAKAVRRLDTKIDVFEKISRIMGGAGVDGPMVADQPAVFQAGPFRFAFLAPSHGDLVLKAHAMLVKAAENVAKFLGYRPSDVAVRIIPEPWQGPEGVAALYDRDILLRAQAFDGGDPAFLPVALAHEYVHLAVDRLSKGACPRWLDEGLAQYVTQNLRPADARILQRALAADALLPLEVLNCDWTLLEDKALIDLAYAQCYSVAQYIVEQSGWGAVRDMLKQAAGGDASSEMEIEKDWLQWLA